MQSFWIKVRDDIYFVSPINLQGIKVFNVNIRNEEISFVSSKKDIHCLTKTQLDAGLLKEFARKIASYIVT
ncbi:hypothetical protein H8S90_14500 [Olivibacter sp. SDN3]|uniref:hypothetical protein n=1 Tax=Olivibacter sp. SDN3 TaxID=2764720 RepID=UPI0016515CB5|nr:hypothetical protein [Olivibacter sp. SDN3]QNL48018.1 hypothetical protein H8S90_14500 [Olivibacter sp. SDN3]